MVNVNVSIRTTPKKPVPVHRNELYHCGVMVINWKISLFQAFMLRGWGKASGVKNEEA